MRIVWLFLVIFLSLSGCSSSTDPIVQDADLPGDIGDVVGDDVSFADRRADSTDIGLVDLEEAATDAMEVDVDDGQGDDACSPECDVKECGDDGCGGLCGACVGQDACIAGACICQPQCQDKNCGADGCDGSCGASVGEQTGCVDGLCACIPACDDGQCGEDGCGGLCPLCTVGSLCEQGYCALCDGPLEFADPGLAEAIGDALGTSPDDIDYADAIELEGFQANAKGIVTLGHQVR